MMRVRQSVVSVVILAIFVDVTPRMQKHLLNFINIDEQCTLLAFKKCQRYVI